MSPFVVAGYAIHWVFPTGLDRLAYVATAVEVERIAHQTDDDSLWLLADVKPTRWARVSVGSDAGRLEYAGDPLVFYILAKA